MLILLRRGVAQLGSASVSGAEGRRFKSSRPDFSTFPRLIGWELTFNMFAFLRGTIHSKDMQSGPADRLVLDVGGVGYELSVSRRTLVSLGAVGEDAMVFTCLSIRETEWTIFGFSSTEERQIFSLLQSVSGIGPKLALALVATLGTPRSR